jgi:hypothetical protein
MRLAVACWLAGHDVVSGVLLSLNRRGVSPIPMPQHPAASRTTYDCMKSASGTPDWDKDLRLKQLGRRNAERPEMKTGVLVSPDS